VILKNSQNISKKLSDDDASYESYFKWKGKRTLSRHFTEKVSRCALYDAECRLCSRISDLQMKIPDMASGNNVIMDRSYALLFEGETHVEIGNHEEFNLADQFTITAWIYLDEIKDYRIVDKGTEGQINGYSFDVINKDNRGFLRLCAAGDCQMGMKPLYVGNWYHVAVVFLSGKAASLNKEKWCGVKFYVDGEHDYTAEFPIAMYGIPTVSINNIALRIGRAGSGQAFFKGKIDDVSIWNICLSGDQIRRLMFERLGGNEKGLVSYWSFNEGNGDIVYDYGKRRRHGTIVGNNNYWVPSEEKDLILNKC